jgi:hypothetical protein
MYTNTMMFDLGKNLTGRVDLSVSHSPFGPSSLYGSNQKSGTDAQLFIRNAELNYKISDKASIHLQFRQVPGGFGYGYNPFYGDDMFRPRSAYDNPFFR